MSGNAQELSLSSSQIFRRGISSQEINIGLSQQFLNPAESINPIEISNEKQANKEITSIISKFKENLDWSDQLQLIQQTMSIVKGGAYKYQGFVDEISGLLTMLKFGVNNLRSTLVKNSCLCIAFLAQSLKEKFDSITEPIISALIVPTMHGTSVIAKSCRFAIREIVNNVYTKRTLLSILNYTNSKSSEHRNIVADSLKDIAFSWPRNIILSNIKQIEHSVKTLTNDATKDTRVFAKSALEIFENNQYIQATTEVKNSRKFQEDKTEVIQFTRLEPPIRPKFSSPQKNLKQKETEIEDKTTVSIDLSKKTLSKSRIRQTSDDSINKSFTLTQDEINDLAKVNKLSKNITSIKDNATFIIETLLNYINSNEIDEIILSITLIEKVLGIIYIQFEKYLSQLIPCILEKSDHISYQISKSASNIMNTIPSLYNCDDLIKIAADQRVSKALLLFISQIMRKDAKINADYDTISKLINIMCQLFEKFNETKTILIITSILTEIQSKYPQEFSKYVETADEKNIKALNTLKITQTVKISTENNSTLTTKFSQHFREQIAKRQSLETSNYAPAPTRSSFKKSNVDKTQQETKTVQIIKNPSTDLIISKIKETEDKREHLTSLADAIKEENTYSLDLMKLLISLKRTEFYKETEICFDSILNSCDNFLVVNDCLSQFFLTPDVVHIDSLYYLLYKTTKTLVDDKPTLLLKQLSDFSVSDDPEMRMMSVKCIAALQKNIECDSSFISSQIGPVQARLVQYYFNKF
ncbi:hypothetical protein TVAG_067380 [Trichomonas vaginalis G3]|uniref:CLASP N-terminal domain-containing protein n=1 Tax=Trichomonas vaginalis (strain ATCC PRA-98 / G3) TaxID=412133 RepID=A2DSF4_TRIV3|nr:microtubule binding CLASP family [Trichomonas vaginalis G3]EAY16733.1 hypothetical protein TVAG_067380 [Trichomonas vaginalis G3]KAI5543174.1 microtubule binding CLASP family [Trichomonas vaginalis G3]|eukprot:XP_001328956.1 hypothetical protein [Trichomonas vaginalis G3]